MVAKSVWNLVKTAGSEWMEDKAPRLGAALAYYAIFSIGPLLIELSEIFASARVTSSPSISGL